MKPWAIAVLMLGILLIFSVAGIAVHFVWWKKRKPQEYLPVRVCMSEPMRDGWFPDVVDGVTLKLNDRVVATDQPQSLRNGLWVVKKGKWIRAADLSSDRCIRVGGQVFVQQGILHGGQIFVLQMVHEFADQYENISQPFVFITLTDMVLGTADRHPGAVLTYAPESIRGIQWRDPHEIWREPQLTKIPFEVAAGELAFVPIHLPSMIHQMARHTITLIGDIVCLIEIVVDENNALLLFSAKLPPDVQILSANGTKHLHQAQTTRECILRLSCKSPKKGHILVQ